MNGTVIDNQKTSLTFSFFSVCLAYVPSLEITLMIHSLEYGKELQGTARVFAQNAEAHFPFSDKK